MPSRYLPVSGFCSSMPSATSVTARRCTVLLATPSRLARSLMPISTCSSENALSSRTDGRDRGQPAGVIGGARWRAGRRHVNVPLRGPAFRRTVGSGHESVNAADGRCGQHGAKHRCHRRRAGGGVRRHRGQEEATPRPNVTLRHRRGLRALREAAAVEGRAARQGQARGRADRRPGRARRARRRGQAQHPLHRDRPRGAPGRHHRRPPALRRAGDRHRLADARTAAAADGHAARALPAHRGARPRHQGRPRGAASIWW